MHASDASGHVPAREEGADAACVRLPPPSSCLWERPLITAEHGQQVLEVLVDWFVHVHLVFMVANNMHACLLLVSFYYIYYIMVVVELDGSGAYIGTSLWCFLIIGNNSIYILII